MNPASFVASDELSLMLDFGAMVCGVPSRSVERVLALDEALLYESDGKATPADAIMPSGGIVDVAGTAFAAWDLAELLGVQGATPKAWLLAAAEYSGRSLPLALRTGSCLSIERVPTLVRMPLRVLRGRETAIIGCFAPGREGRVQSRIWGAMIALEHLLTADELELSAQRLATRDDSW